MINKEAIEKLLEKVSANLWDYTSPNVVITNKHIADSKKLIDQAIALSKPEPLRNQPCGCILCDCDSEGRCLGCGSKMCEKHQEIGHLPKNEMAYHKAEQPSASEFAKDIQDALKVMSSNGKFHRKIMEKACKIIDASEASRKELVEALKKYGDHEPGCIKGDACNCGLKAAIEKAKN